MDKTIIIFILMIIIFFGCKKDKCKNKERIDLGQGSEWFSKLNKTSKMAAYSKDSLTELYFVTNSSSEYSHVNVEKCLYTVGTDSRMLSYDPSLYNERFVITISGLRNNNRQFYFYCTKGNNKTSYTANLNNNENLTLYQEDVKIGNYLYFVGDTSISNFHYSDIYRIDIKDTLSKGVLKKMIFSISYGILEYQSFYNRYWIFKPQ